jgi:DNA polymerase-1
VRIGKSKAYAKQLLQADREIFHVYWEWLDTARLNCFMAAEQSTVFGWRKRITSRCDNPRAVGNFFSQANGGEMMRLAAIFATEARIQVCAPVHDAFLIMAPLELLDAHTGQMRRYMEKASEIVLDGFCLRTEEHPFPYPKRYSCKKGEAMWNKVMALL